MRTVLTSDNPFGPTRYGFLWQVLRERGGSSRHLDLGTFDGRVPASLQAGGLVDEAIGVDVVPELRERDDAGLSIRRIRRGEPLPFPDGHFTSASLLDVLEHVADQRRMLAELRRVLAEGAPLILTVPRRHLFSVLDTGNLKFRFPRAHRWYHVRHGGLEAYRARFGGAASGLIGDIEVEKGWHEHFTPRRLGSLLGEAGFTVEREDGSGLLMRPLLALTLAGGWARRLLAPALEWDSARFSRANLFVVARATD